jgi:CubicO group peptidase (beta-lactamase class C family)
MDRGVVGSGLSKAGLERMHDVMAAHVEAGTAPGLVALVSRRGEVHVDAIGATSVGGDEPMRRDTIFRVASMTKPVTAVAALILVEECVLRMDEPVDRFLPELTDRRVLRRLDGPVDDTVPAHRPITLRDLLTFRMGFGLVMGGPDQYPILGVAADLGFVQGPPQPGEVPDPDEWLRRFATLPLMHQPGERWMYNTGSDVLGVLIARAAGRPLEAFMRERIFEPLDMRDTGFSVPPSELHRLATSYTTDPVSGALSLFDEADGGQWSAPPAFASGAGGLASTADDFLAFGRMLLDNGACRSGRILSRPAVAAMTTDQLTAEQKAGSAMVPGQWDCHGWGFGVSIVTRRDGLVASPGSYGWSGGLGTSWLSDPLEQMVGVHLTQAAWVSPEPPPVCQDFWTTAYAAIDD